MAGFISNFLIHIYTIYLSLFLFSNVSIEMISKVKLATVVEGDQKAPFSIATTLKCREERYSFPRIATPYPWYIPYIAEC